MFRETLLILSFIGIIYSFEPSCTTCKFFIPHQSNPDLGLCNVFKEKSIDDINLIKNFATHCRKDENLCGKSGFLYEKKDEVLLDEKKEMIENLCCGEVNEKYDIDELEKLEKDIVEIYQRIRLHNTKKIYKTTRDLYKLFKKK
jgi:hypothetical protein